MHLINFPAGFQRDFGKFPLSWKSPQAPYTVTRKITGLEQTGDKNVHHKRKLINKEKDKVVQI